MGNFEQAAEEFKKSHELNPSDEWTFLYLAATYGHLGRKKAALSAMEEFEKRRAAKGRRPYTLANMDGWHFPNPDIRERFRDGLRKAGIPPGASASREYPVDKPPPEIEGAETIDAMKAKALFDRGVPFVDVRKDPDWNTERIPGAVQLHLYADFSELNLSKIAAKDDEIVVYAYGLHSGHSTTAVMRTISWGHKKIYFFREGFPGWKAAGLPVETVSK
jgi:rhodanese-related sulfurtransferase